MIQKQLVDSGIYQIAQTALSRATEVKSFALNFMMLLQAADESEALADNVKSQCETFLEEIGIAPTSPAFTFLILEVLDIMADNQVKMRVRTMALSAQEDEVSHLFNEVVVPVIRTNVIDEVVVTGVNPMVMCSLKAPPNARMHYDLTDCSLVIRRAHPSEQIAAAKARDPGHRNMRGTGIMQAADGVVEICYTATTVEEGGKELHRIGQQLVKFAAGQEHYADVKEVVIKELPFDVFQILGNVDGLKAVLDKDLHLVYTRIPEGEHTHTDFFGYPPEYGFCKEMEFAGAIWDLEPTTAERATLMGQYLLKQKQAGITYSHLFSASRANAERMFAAEEVHGAHIVVGTGFDIYRFLND